MITGRRIWGTWGLALMLVLLLGTSPALAASARIDPDFGNGGVARTAFPPQTEVSPFRELVATPAGGAIVRSGFYESTEIRDYGPDGSLGEVEPEVENGDEIEIERAEAATPGGGRLVSQNKGDATGGAVARHLPDGSLDSSYGSGGKSEEVPLHIEALALLPSGKVLAAGKGILQPGGTKTEPTYQVLVARLGADGRLDPTFGKEGIASLGSEDSVEGSEALFLGVWAGEGAEVVTGSTAVGLDATGELARSFGDGGRITLPGPATGAAAAAGETLLVAGSRPVPPAPRSGGPSAEARAAALARSEFYAARYTAAGKLDPAYAGGSGVAVLGGEAEAVASSAVIGSDGSATVGGLTARTKGCPPGYACDRTPTVVGFTPEGRPDGGFGQRGIVRLSTLSVPFETDYSDGVAALAARPGGGVFAAGQGLGCTFLAALAADGSLAPTFAGNGLITKSGSGVASYASAVATGTDEAGDVFALLGTNSGTGLSESAVVTRYSPGGKLDEGFGEGGKAYVPPNAEALAVGPDGSSFVISGTSGTLTKLTPSGSPDASFGIEGTVTFPKFEGFFVATIALSADGDLLVGGVQEARHGARVAVERFLASGKVDGSFGKDGVSSAKLPGENARDEVNVTSMAVDPQGRILFAGSQYHSCCREIGMVARFRPDGGVDHSFGHGGFIRVGKDATSVLDVAARGSRVFAVARSSHGHGPRRLLYAFDAGGKPAQGFGKAGVATVKTRSRPAGGNESLRVFPTARRVLVSRAGSGDPLAAFSTKGKAEPGFTRKLKGLVPHRTGHTEPFGPVVSLAGNELIVAWSDSLAGPTASAKEGELSLRRVLLE